MEDYLELKQALEDAEMGSTDALEALRVARHRLKECERDIKNSLTVSASAPCRVAKLPSGQVVVHVEETDPRRPNKLFVVEIESL